MSNKKKIIFAFLMGSVFSYFLIQLTGFPESKTGDSSYTGAESRHYNEDVYVQTLQTLTMESMIDDGKASAYMADHIKHRLKMFESAVNSDIQAPFGRHQELAEKLAKILSEQGRISVGRSQNSLDK